MIEWNTHMFSANTAKFPFHPQAVYKPDAASFQADPLAAYEKHMAETGIAALDRIAAYALRAAMADRPSPERN